MPSNVRRLYTSFLLVVTGGIGFALAQAVPQATPSPTTTAQVPPQSLPQTLPTSGDVMRERISKAKAFIVVRNYNAAIYELENIRKETGDPSVNAVVNVLLMNSYLEQGDFKRAQDFLTLAFNVQKTTKPNALATYTSIAGQVVKSARNRVERYHALGLNMSDRTLPLEALNDIEKMREMLEMVIMQSKEIGKDKAKTPAAMALVEEASNSRSVMARDDYDARRWRDEIADTREQIASSQSVVTSAVNDAPADTSPTNPVSGTNTANTNQNPVNQNQNPASSQPVYTPVNIPGNPTRDREVKNADAKPADFNPDNTNNVAKNDKPVYVPEPQQTVKEEPKPTVPAVVKEEPKAKPETKTAETANDSSPMDVGSSLIGYATKQTPPVYPPAARNLRATGIVKVEVTINESGEVAEVQKTSGPALLQGAAKDAIRKWKFRPFLRDGQPVRAIGTVSFNFAL